jgi:hypothetical protein
VNVISSPSVCPKLATLCVFLGILIVCNFINNNTPQNSLQYILVAMSAAFKIATLALYQPAAGATDRFSTSFIRRSKGDSFHMLQIWFEIFPLKIVIILTNLAG